MVYLLGQKIPGSSLGVHGEENYFDMVVTIMFDLKYFLSLALPLAVLVIYTFTLQQNSSLVAVARSISSKPLRSPVEVVPKAKTSTDELASKYEIFLLEKWCSLRCEADVARELETRFKCTDITVLPMLRSVHAKCNAIKSMTPQEIKRNVVQKITGVKGYVHNLKLPSSSIGERVNARDISSLPPVQRKQSGFMFRFIQSISGVLPWGLDRIDQMVGMDGKFDLSCFPNLGAGVTIYVLDTGCRNTHDDLKGRTRIEKVGRYETAEDDNGHGTHVAGTAAGTNYGVCKRCEIVCIKTLDENSKGTLADVSDAVEFVLEQKRANPSIPAVAVMSLGDPLETNILDLAVDKLAKEGVFPAVSAGNGFADACEWTPPRAEYAITVGATMENDGFRFSSNYGKCVKIVAPGEEVRAASHQGDSLYVTMSGTSMAAPYVAGVAGLILGEDGGLTPAQVLEKMKLKAKIVDDNLHGSKYPLLRVLHENCDLYGFKAFRPLSSTPLSSVSTTTSLSASPASEASTSLTPSSSASLIPSPSASFSASPSMSTTTSTSSSFTSSPSLSLSPSTSASPTSSLSMSNAPPASSSPTPSPSASFMPSTSPSVSPSVSSSPRLSMSVSAMPSMNASNSPAKSPTSTHSPMGSPMASPSVSLIPSPAVSASHPPSPSNGSMAERIGPSASASPYRFRADTIV